MIYFCGNRDCFKAATFVCTRCHSVYYCSKQCQLQCFAEHRYSCFEIPALSPIGVGNWLLSYNSHPIEASTMNLPRAIEEQKSNGSVGSPERGMSDIKQVFPRVNSPTLENVERKDELKAPIVKEKDKQPKAPVLEQKDEPPKAPIVEHPKKPIVEHPKKPIVEQPKAPAVKLNMQDLRKSHNMFSTEKKEPLRFYFKDLTVIDLPSADFKAGFLTGDESVKIFSVYPINYGDHLALVEQTVFDIATKDDSTLGYKPDLDEMVLCKFEGIYYRAVVKSTAENGFHVKYVDYGNDAIVNETDIKKFDKKLVLDIVSHNTYLENIPDVINEEIAQVLNKGEVLLHKAHFCQKSGMYIAQIVGL